MAGRVSGQIISPNPELSCLELGLGLFKDLLKYLKLEVVFMPWAASFYLNLYVEGPAHSTHLSVSPEAMVRLTREVLNFNIQTNLIIEPSPHPLPRAFAFLHCLFLPFHLRIIQLCHAEEFMDVIVLFCTS